MLSCVLQPLHKSTVQPFIRTKQPFICAKQTGQGQDAQLAPIYCKKVFTSLKLAVP